MLLMISCNPEDFFRDKETENVTKTELASDYDWDNSAATIAFNGTSITTNSSNVTISNDTAIITAGGYYTVSGNLTDGQLQINAPKALVKLELNGVSLNSSTTSPFYIKSGTKVILFLKSGTTNTIKDAASYTNPDGPRAAIASEAYIGITGDGILNVIGYYNDGISSDDPIVINEGTINVSAIDDGIRSKDYIIIHNGNISSLGVTGHALKADSTASVGKGYIKIDGGNFNLTSSQGDGIHTYKHLIIESGTFNIISEESQAIKSDSSVIISGGTINITDSEQGIECPNITINGGTTTVNTSKTAVNASSGNSPISANNCLLIISGGNLYVNSLGNGLNSDGNIEISGGETIIQGALKTSKPSVSYLGKFNISNGFFIACGPNAGSLIQSFSSTSTQNCIKISSSSIGTNYINIQDASNNSLVTFKPFRTSYYILFSSPSIQTSTLYKFNIGGNYSGGSTKNGYYTDGSYIIGTTLSSFTVNGNITELGL